MFKNMLQVAIYYVEGSLKPYHLVLEDTQDNKKTEFIASANSPQELYLRAFEMADKVYGKNLLAYAITQRNKVEQQEQISLGVGKGYLHRGEQHKATYHFSRANQFFQQRTVLESEILNLMGVNICEQNFVNPVQL